MTIEAMIRAIVRDELAALIDKPWPPGPRPTVVLPRYAAVLAFFEQMPPGTGGKAADVYAAFRAWQADGPPGPAVSMQRFGREARRASGIIARRVTGAGVTYVRRGDAAPPPEPHHPDPAAIPECLRSEAVGQ